MLGSHNAPAFSARKVQLSVVAACLLLPLSLSYSAPSQPTIANPAVVGDLTVAQVLSNVRQAIGYRKLKGLKQEIT